MRGFPYFAFSSLTFLPHGLFVHFKYKNLYHYVVTCTCTSTRFLSLTHFFYKQCLAQYLLYNISSSINYHYPHILSCQHKSSLALQCYRIWENTLGTKSEWTTCLGTMLLRKLEANIRWSKQLRA